HFKRALRSIGSSGVHEHFDSLEFSKHTFRHSSYLRQVGDITGTDHEMLAEISRKLRRLPEHRLSSTHQSDVPVLLDQRQRNGLTHAAARACDDCWLAHVA